jgi:hypothetical protein
MPQPFFPEDLQTDRPQADVQQEPTSLGQVAYEAYATHQSWLSFRGTALPVWLSQEVDIQQAWEAAARAALARGLDAQRGRD